jgi:tetratricopeptide (TPR) repeat protein
VVNALKLSLLGGLAPRTEPTTNREAYLLYLQAQEIHYRGNTFEASQKAVEYLQQALKLDPEFAQEWAALAGFLAGDYNLFTPRPHAQVRAQISAALDHARELDPSLPRVHVEMGRAPYEVDWSWQAADSELRQAIALEPGNAEARRLAEYLATTYGRFDEAIEQLDKAIELDPLQPWNYIGRGYAACRSCRLADAEANYRTALDLAPASGKFHFLLGSVLIVRGRSDSALAVMAQEADPRIRHAGMALALDALGHRNEADQELEIAEQKFGDDLSYRIAEIYAARRDPDRAFAWLDRAVHNYSDGLIWIEGDLLMRGLIADPRYQALLHRMNLPE